MIKTDDNTKHDNTKMKNDNNKLTKPDKKNTKNKIMIKT